MTKPKTKAKVGAEARKRLFIEAMVRNKGNQRAAALEAGAKNDRAADQYALRMLSIVEVQQEIARRAAETLAAAEMETGISVSRTLREAGRLGYLDPAQFFDKEGNLLEIHEMPVEARVAVAGLEITEQFAGTGEDRKHVGFLKKIKFVDKNAALEKLMKHLGLFERDNRQKPPTLAPVFNIIAVRPK